MATTILPEQAESLSTLEKTDLMSNRFIVNKQFVHKKNQENVLITSVERSHSSDESEERFTAEVQVNKDHSFFFEHQRGHVPGLYIVEAGRQLGIAISHIFYDVPFDSEFILNDMNVSFQNFASTYRPLIAHGVTANQIYKKGRLTKMTFKGHFTQGKKVIAEMNGELVVLPRGVVTKMERAADNYTE